MQEEKGRMEGEYSYDKEKMSYHREVCVDEDDEEMGRIEYKWDRYEMRKRENLYRRLKMKRRELMSEEGKNQMEEGGGRGDSQCAFDDDDKDWRIECTLCYRVDNDEV